MEPNSDSGLGQNWDLKYQQIKNKLYSLYYKNETKNVFIT